ncbi:MAG TPA: sigma-70 family RNA polymerase sigma factor [Lacipirellulaceae bacterium]|nr:sigma-70 family RNA polymerase sigma factor [Lacipirellulaceae bacterium]
MDHPPSEHVAPDRPASGERSAGEISNAGAAQAGRGGQKFVELLGAHERELFGYIYSLTANWDDSQEIMQRLRIRIWEQFERYDQARPFGAWARAIAYYLVLAFRKERSRQREYFTERVIQLLDEAYAQSTGGMGRSREALVECLAKLTTEKQKLVTDYYSPGGAAALAQSLGMTGNSLRQAVHRIRRQLHQCVQRSLRASS